MKTLFLCFLSSPDGACGEISSLIFSHNRVYAPYGWEDLRVFYQDSTLVSHFIEEDFLRNGKKLHNITHNSMKNRGSTLILTKLVGSTQGTST